MGINVNRILQETSRVQPHLVAGYHGEDIRLEVTYRNYGQPVSLDGADVTFYWRTSLDQPGHWHEAAGSVEDGVAVAVWDPSMDAGPDDVQWFIRVDLDDSTTYRAAGAFRLQVSPGFVPAILPPAVVTLDFANVQVLNAPYYTKSETDTEIASAVGGITGDSIPLGVGPGGATPGSVSQALLAVDTGLQRHVDNTSNPHQVTAAQVGAMASSATGATIPIAAGGSTIKDTTDALATSLAAKFDKSGGAISNDVSVYGRVESRSSYGYAALASDCLELSPDDETTYSLYFPEKDGTFATTDDITPAPVQSVNMKTGAVVLTASDVGALPSSYTAPVTSVNTKTGAVVLNGTDLLVGGTSSIAQATVEGMISDFVGAIGGLGASIGAIDAKIPSEATSSNQLSDKAWVTTQITNTVGTINTALDTINGEVI